MERNQTTLLIGAGAETDEPYDLPSGNKFVWETCHAKDGELCERYVQNFLHCPNSPTFKELVKSIADSNDEKGMLKTFLSQKQIKHFEQEDEFGEEACRHFFNKVIATTSGEEYKRDYKECAQKHLPEDAYFGSLEGYFSSLLNPSAKYSSFWKSVNYYWSAFLAISSPLTLYSPFRITLGA